MNEVLPCPFCGAEAIIEQVDDTNDYRWDYWVACTGEKHHHLDFLCATEEEAVEVWNERPQEAADESV